MLEIAATELGEGPPDNPGSLSVTNPRLYHLRSTAAQTRAGSPTPFNGLLLTVFETAPPPTCAPTTPPSGPPPPPPPAACRIVARGPPYQPDSDTAARKRGPDEHSWL